MTTQKNCNWRVMRGPEMVGIVELPDDPSAACVMETLASISIVIDPVDTMVKTGRSIIYITNRRKHVLIDLIRDF